MKKNILKILITLFMMSLFSTGSKAKNSKIEDVYQFSFVNFDETKINLADYKNKVLLIVNTASKCGFTKQYEGLEKLSQKYKDRGLMIIGVPSNNFGNQEPGNNEEIQRFCKYNYGVNFLVTQKEVVTGKEAHPFYLFAKEKLGALGSPKWNFHKYLIGRDGKLVDYFISSTTPESEKIINAIEKELKK
jgi:glutathione peroxidase